jgi:hypothetical protein
VENFGDHGIFLFPSSEQTIRVVIQPNAAIAMPVTKTEEAGAHNRKIENKDCLNAIDAPNPATATAGLLNTCPNI